MWGVFTAAEDCVMTVNENGDCCDFFISFAGFGEPVLGANFDINVRNREILLIPKDFIRVKIGNVGVLVTVITVYWKGVNVFIPVKEFACIVDVSGFDWLNVISC